MNIQKLISQFNQPDTHLVISEWPEIRRGKSYHGVAAFTKETLCNLTQTQNMRFVVLAEIGEDSQPKISADGKILVLRVFDHKHPALYPTILTWLTKFSQIKHVTVHSEFGACAGLKHFVLLLPFLALIKIMGRNITYFAHNVVRKVDYLAPHFNLHRGKLFLRGLNNLLKFYYKMLGVLVDRIVVLETTVFANLKKHVSGEKLVYIPHFVKPRTTKWTKIAAKTQLGLDPQTRVILAFGFISSYKGSDILAQLFTRVSKGNKQYQLVFAGGHAPSIEGTQHYAKYYRDLDEFISKQTNIRLTGFVPEDQVGLYFAAADLVVLPYRGLMGASGALAYAMGFGKPFLVSKHMSALWKNPDLKQSLKTAGITHDDVMFSLNQTGIRRILSRLRNKKELTKLAQLSHLTAQTRHIERFSGKLYTEIYVKQLVQDNKSYAKIVPAIQT